MRHLWKLQPEPLFEVGCDLLCEPDDPDYEPETVGPFLAKVRWSPDGPKGVDGELHGDVALGRSLDLPRGKLTLVGRLASGSDFRVEDVFLTRWTTESSDDHGPRRIAEFTGGDMTTKVEHPTDREPRAASVSFLLPPDRVWGGFDGRFRSDGEVVAPTHRLDIVIEGLRIITEQLRFDGHFQMYGTPTRATRIAMALTCTPTSPEPVRVAQVIALAEPIIQDLLLVAGLAAGRPFHPLGGLGHAFLQGTGGVNIFEEVEFTRERHRDDHPSSHHHEVNVGRDGLLQVLSDGVRVLRSDSGAKHIRLSLQAYVSSLYRAFDTQQFLAVCTGIEALREWHSRKKGWHDLVKGRAAKNALREHLRAGLIEAAKGGHISGFAHTEALNKLDELFRPRFVTVLRDLIKEQGVRVDDLFAQGRGEVDFDFLTVRNRLVHRGEVPDHEQLSSAHLRARYLLERLLFAIFGYHGRLNAQWPVPIPAVSGKPA